MDARTATTIACGMLALPAVTAGGCKMTVTRAAEPQAQVVVAPGHAAVVVTMTAVVINEKIQFETDSVVILPISFGILNQVAAALNNNPQILLVEIQGHADERNTDEYNIVLTRDRAAAVAAYLVRQGVDPHRMLAAGYGERCPIDPAHNEAAWDKNRRVEFKILWTNAGPTNVQRSCPAGAALQPRLPPEFQR